MAKIFTSKYTELVVITIVGALLAITLLALSLTLHLTHERILTAGLDNYQYHVPLFGERQVSQEIKVEHEIRGVGAILVNLRRADSIPGVLLTVVDPQSGETLDTIAIPPEQIIDDTFATVALTRPILPTHDQRLRLIFSAPGASAAQAVGIRFHPDDPYSFSSYSQNGAVKTGDLALILQERVRLGEYVITTVLQNRAWRPLGIASFAALAVTVLAGRVGWRTQSDSRRRLIAWAVLISIALLALGLHVLWLPSFHGVSGGDPYNYLVITQQLAKLGNPFEISKRLPGFPLLLLPAYLTSIDDIWWMRVVSIISAALSVLLTALVARRLRLPWPVQVTAACLLVAHKDFWWTSFRPEAYSFYGALLLLALYLLFDLTTARAKVLLGVVLGYAAMTRQEGFVLAAIVLGSLAIFWRQLLHMPTSLSGIRVLLPHSSEWRLLGKHALLVLLPAAVIVFPFFLHNALKYGNPIYTEYFEGERLQIVNSFNAFMDNAGATWGVLGSMWRPQWSELYRIPFTHPTFLVAAVAAIGWWFINFTALHRRSTSLRIGLMVAWIALWCSIVWLVSAHRSLLYDTIMLVTAAVFLISPLPLLAATTWRGGIVMAVAVSQTLVALWFHPFAKHYQQVYPLFILAFAIVIIPQTGRHFRHHARSAGSAWMRRVALFTLLTPLFLVAVFLWQSQTAFIDKYNRAVALDTVVYRATQFALQQPGPHGTDQPYVPVHLYFSGDINYFFGDEPQAAARAVSWVAEHGIKTLITTNNNPAFRHPPADWEILKTFKAEGRDEFIYESRVYRIP